MTKLFLTALVASTSFAGAAHAAPDMLKLGVGTYDIVLPAAFPTTEISEQFKISLNQVSHVTGTITGMTSVDQFTASTFSEMMGVVSLSADVQFVPSPFGDLATFDFGVLTLTAYPPGWVGIPDPDNYVLNLSGVVSPVAVLRTGAVKLTLNVTAVPEASTWLMMALGLGAVAAARRRSQG